MCTIIHGIPVMIDPTLSREEINKIVNEIIQDWAWEGRNLGKIELLSDGNFVHICSYAKPAVKLIPLSN